MSQHCKANPCCGDIPCSGVPQPQYASGLTKWENSIEAREEIAKTKGNRMIDKDNRHTVYFATHSVTYWLDGVACGEHDDWSHCDVQSRIPFGGGLRLTKEQSSLLQQINRLMEDAWVIGQGEAKRVMREAIGAAMK